MKLLRRFHNSSIRTKYLIAVAALVGILSLCGVYVYKQTANTLYQSYIDGAKADFSNTYNELERFEERLNHLATLLQSDTNLVSLLSGTEDCISTPARTCCPGFTPCWTARTTISAACTWAPPWTLRTAVPGC